MKPLDALLDELQPMTGNPLQLERISDAKTNAVYRLSSPAGQWALRRNRTNSEMLGINRASELLVLNAVRKQPFSPTVCASDETFLLTQWAEGELYSVSNDHQFDELISLIRAVHAVPIPSGIDQLNIAERLSLLSTQSKGDEVQRVLDKKLTQYQPSASPVLCYHDWHSGNMLKQTEGLFLLDWEYASSGDAMIDLACCVDGLLMNESQRQPLLEAFGVSDQQLSLAQCLTQLMSLLWHEVRFGQIDASKRQDWLTRYGH